MRIASSPGAALEGGAVDAPREASPLRENFAWTLAGNVVYAGCQWGILVVVARLASPEAVGQLALGYALTAPVFLFAGLQLRASQATDAARRFRFAEYRAVRIAGMAAGLALTAAIVLLSHHDGPTRLVVLAVAASKAVEGLSDVYYGVLQQHERMRPMAVSLVWRGILSVAAVAAVLALGGGLAAAVAALAASWLMVLLVHDVRAAAPLVRAPPPGAARVDGGALRRIVATSFPLGLVIMLLSLRSNVPRYFIEGELGAADLGVFAALSSLLVAGNVVVSALGQSATPRLARHFHEGDLRAFRRLLRWLLAVAAAVGIGGVALAIAAGRPLLLALFGAPYAARAELLVLVMGVALVAYVASFLGYALTAARRFAVQPPLFAATTLACAAASFWLVPAHGLAGAAAAWGGSLLVEVAAVWAVLELALRRRAEGGLS
jgi:O-antigen/teichoic acid export membrane protein